MFTGIITNLGKIEELKFSAKKDCLIKISAKKIAERSLQNGCSIACNGICLTLVKKEISAQKNIFFFQASEETCKKTNVKNWKIGDIVNLEFSLKVGDELGGHMVLGHVDATAKIKAIEPIKDSHKFTFEAPKDLLKFIAPKGSIVLNGVSLTVNEVQKNLFTINIIPHSFTHTNFQNLQIGDLVNLEIDVIARYLQKALQKND
jgi:riboflavin synthase